MKKKMGYSVAVQRAAGKKGAAKSPWRYTPACETRRAFESLKKLSKKAPMTE